MKNDRGLLGYYRHVCSQGMYKIIGPLPTSHREVLRLFAGATCGMGVVSYLAMSWKLPVLVASLGASACLIFYVPNGPFSQPRNVIMGQVIAALTGVAALNIFGCTWYGAALSVSGAIVAMIYTKTVHPPAAATALIAVTTNQSILFALLPVGAGATLLVISGLIVNRLVPRILASLSSKQKETPVV